MTLDELPQGPVVQACPHGILEHLECPACDRAADVGHPTDGGPRAAVTFRARYDDRCPCGMLIFINDRVMKNDDGHVLCRRCTETAKGRL